MPTCKKLGNVVELANILQEHGLHSIQAKEYIEQYKDDSEFFRRARTVRRLFRHRKAIMRAVKTTTKNQ